MSIGKRLFAGMLASTLALGGSTAIAQDALPGATPSIEEQHIILASPEGDLVATARFIEIDEGVTITVTTDADSGLEPGEHGIHIHERGVCTPTEGDEPFSDAGGHYNPTDAEHGGPEDEDAHAGDLGNLTVEEDGTIDFEITTDRVTLVTGEENSLADEDGSALIIHADQDDLETDPSGESGERVACGTIFQHPQGTPVATPDTDGLTDEDDDATPES